jgi:hypothetical protein
MILADAKAIRPLTDEKHTLESNQLALKAAGLGLEVLRPTYLTDKDQRIHNTNFLEKIQASDIAETYDRLSALESGLLEHRTVRLNRWGFQEGRECDSLPVGGDLRCRSPIRLIFASVW